MNKIKNELKQTFTNYWEYLALQTACRLNIFDDIENGFNTIEKLSLSKSSNKKILETFLSTLVDAKTIYEINGQYFLTEKGKLLTENHPETLKHACILWGEEHLTAWQNLEYTLKTGKSAFEHIFKAPFFDFIKNKPEKLKNYQLAMQEYALDDYRNIAEVIDFSEFNTIADVGGGTGVLIKNIAKKYPHKNCIFTDLKEVTALLKSKPKNLTVLSHNFFESFSFKADAIILSRVLHDWNDEKAKIILNNCYKALNQNGKLFVVEIMQEEITANLLTLNMMIMTEAYERTFDEYRLLLKDANFKLSSKIKLNELQTILISIKQ